MMKFFLWGYRLVALASFSLKDSSWSWGCWEGSDGAGKHFPQWSPWDELGGNRQHMGPNVTSNIDHKAEVMPGRRNRKLFVPQNFPLRDGDQENVPCVRDMRSLDQDLGIWGIILDIVQKRGGEWRWRQPSVQCSWCQKTRRHWIKIRPQWPCRSWY